MKALKLPFLLITALLVGVPRAAEEFGVYDSAGNRLIYVQYTTNGTGVFQAGTVFDGFPESAYLLAKTVPHYDQAGSIIGEDYNDFNDLRVRWARYSAAGGTVAFTLYDHFQKGQVVYRGAYQPTGQGNRFDFTNNLGSVTHSIVYEGAGEVAVLDASGAEMFRVRKAATAAVDRSSGALERRALSVDQVAPGVVRIVLPFTAERTTHIDIFDTRGRRLYHSMGPQAGELRVSLSGEASGVALVRVRGEGFRAVRQINMVSSGSRFGGGWSGESARETAAVRAERSGVVALAQEIPPSLLTELLYYYGELPGASHTKYRSPVDMVLSPGGDRLYVASQTARHIDIVDPTLGNVVGRIQLPSQPRGLALSDDGATLYASCYADERPMGVLCVVDVAARRITKSIPVGHSPRGPVVGKDGKVYVCNQFSDRVTEVDVVAGKVGRSAVADREPFAAALTPDGATLVVTNFLPSGRSDGDTVGAKVTLIDVAAMQVIDHLQLCNGAQSLADVCISPDGKYAYVTHIRSLHTMTPLNKLTEGWINANAVSIIDIPARKVLTPFLLDDNSAGAANPWGIQCTDKLLAATSAGTGEVHVMDRSLLHQKIVAASGIDLEYSLSFSGLFTKRRRTDMVGARAIVLRDSTLHVAGYFSDKVQTLRARPDRVESVRVTDLGTAVMPDIVRTGEKNFWDAREMCLQMWQSCTSCHPFVRSDGLKWDLENDGLGNFKNDKSLLYSHVTPPVMITGVRDSAEMATRKGIELILFIDPSSVADKALAIDEYLKTVRHVPSPRLENGRLTAKAERGRGHFNRLQCNNCHIKESYYVDFTRHYGIRRAGDIGLYDGNWDTPTLHEVWRTAPYLHDGGIAKMRDLFVGSERHEMPFVLSDTELEELVEYVESL